ncbi:MAG: OsmC family protein [bacterium]|nr:OsmC family protein [bacterium]
MTEIKTTFIKDMKFVAMTTSGNKIVMDTLKENGAGATPMELLLAALTGCTGMDIVSILKKMQLEFSKLEIVVKGEKSEEHPKIYKKIKLIYKLYGNLPPDKVKNAIELSINKYCSVSNMLKSAAEITYEYQILDSEQ